MNLPCCVLAASALAGALALGACGTETTLVPAADIEADTSQGGEDTAAPEEDTKRPDDGGPLLRESAKYGWKIPGEVPAPMEGCKVNEQDLGTTVKWLGLQIGEKVYTCNRCPGGDQFIQGKWRYTHDPDNVDVTSPSGWKETVTFDGNTFKIQTAFDGDATTIEGWYWCGQKPEVGNETYTFIVEKVTTTGTCTSDSCWEPGLIFSGYTLLDMQANSLLWQTFWDFSPTGTTWNDTAPYCRIGADSLGKPCVDELAQ